MVRSLWFDFKVPSQKSVPNQFDFWMIYVDELGQLAPV